ncbi:MAG: Uma2 family endonuclease [Pseudanabaena sp.]|jgi:Uma2 family endonuclease|nr:Uma2 family endonuclease [Pseudanabaena sp. M109S1SP1A06QC]MCA6615212.1 Uma2 family endonuclease [Pseudanabaena sp. M090S1SP1A06QC]
MVNTLPQQTTSEIVEIESDAWIPPMPPTDLIFDDGEPLETNQHRVAMNVLIRSYQQYRGADTDFYVGGNMFIYYSTTQVKNRDFRGPDFFVALDVDGQRDRLGWVVWEEEGRYPDIIIELMSPSTANVDLGLKKQLYDRVFKTQDYFVYNPFDPNSLQGWHRNSTYEAIAPDERGWLWCESLGLWLGTWQGTIDRETLTWLRFYDQSGALVLLPEEAAQQRAETEAQRAEAEAQRAEIEAQRAETEAQRAETERLRAERLAARLRELGEDPDSL